MFYKYQPKSSQIYQKTAFIYKNTTYVNKAISIPHDTNIPILVTRNNSYLINCNIGMVTTLSDPPLMVCHVDKSII